MVLFLSVAGSIFQNIAIHKISQVLIEAPISQITQLIAGTKSPSYLALSGEDQALVIPEITDSMQKIWVFFTAAAGLSFILSLPLAVSSTCGRRWLDTNMLFIDKEA